MALDASAHICGAVGEPYRDANERLRDPVCNRVRGHDGSHREYEPGTFAVLREWAPEP